MNSLAKIYAMLNNDLENPTYKAFCLNTLGGKYSKDFIEIPAARYYHHNYKGGLVVHTAEVMVIAQELARYSDVEHDDVIVCALFHDFGKMKAYYFDENDEIQFNNEKDKHVKDGLEIVKELFNPYDNLGGLYETVCNSIKSHMGNLEWGALKRPENDLEWIIHLADMYSAKIKSIHKL
jgi:3'-5' exoribonuclease